MALSEITRGTALQNLFAKIDAILDLRGAGIGYIGANSCRVLRASQHHSGLQTFVIVQETEEEPPSSSEPPKAPSAPPSLAMELVGVGLNCTGAVFGWMAVAGTGVATVGTGGAATALTILSWSAAVSTSIACGASIVRAVDVKYNDAAWTCWLDSNDYYQWASMILDGISLAGAATSTAAAIRAAQAIRRASNAPWAQILRGMSRADRKRLAKELMRLKYPGMSNQKYKELIKLGQIPARLGAQEISARLFTQLKDALPSALSFTSSGVSGLVKTTYVHVFQE